MLPTADCCGEGVYLLAQAGRRASPTLGWRPVLKRASMDDTVTGFPPHSVSPQTRCSAASWSHCASGRGTPYPALCGSALLLWTREVTFPESPLLTGQSPTSPTQVCPLSLHPHQHRFEIKNLYLLPASSPRSGCGWHLPGERELGSGPEASLLGGQR